VRVKLVLPALTEAKSPFFRPIKYSLWPAQGAASVPGVTGAASAAPQQAQFLQPGSTVW
jgi:hypothetical protein